MTYNFSSYRLTADEEYVLDFNLRKNMTMKINNNKIKTEFESFFF